MLLKVLLNLQYKQQTMEKRNRLKVFNNNNDNDR